MVLPERIWRFFAQLRRRRRHRRRSRRPSGAATVGGMDDRVLERSGDRLAERGGGGFMFSARMVSSSPAVVRTVSMKRKLEELDSGLAESSGSTNSAARVRREREAENFGRREAVLGENFTGGIQQAQPLDSDLQMVEETGNSIVDEGAARELVRKAQPGGEIETLIDMMSFNIFEDVVNEGNDQVEAGSGCPIASLCPIGPEIQQAEVDGAAVEAAAVEGVETRKTDVFQRDQEKDPAFALEEEAATLNSKFLREEFLSDVMPGDVIPGEGGGFISAGSNHGGCCGSACDGTLATSAGVLVKSIEADVEASAKPRLQFFVRTFMDGRTVVVHACSSDTVEYVQRQIQLKTGLPTYEQRLIYGGKQLQQDQTLEDCCVVNDAMLHLVARMRSTVLPQSWQLINDFVATTRSMCEMGEQLPAAQRKLSHLQDSIRNLVKEFLKMASKSVSVTEHMLVFQLSGATSALVMLLLSSVQSNCECAEECIKLFLSSNEDFLPSSIYSYCAPLLLEFCKLLIKSAPGHCLYTVCRNALASLLDTIGTAHGSPYFNEAKAETIVQDFSPFVLELSLKLVSNLRGASRPTSAKDKPVSMMQYVKEGQDFTAFVIPLCKAMEACKGIGALGTCDAFKNDGAKVSDWEELAGKPVGCSRADGLMVDIGSHKWLRKVFRKLLSEIDVCLEVVGDGLVAPEPSTHEDHPFGWAPFLFILKGLHAIAKLYEGDMEDFLGMLHARRSALNILIQQSRWHDDHFWLLEHGFLLDFESKKRLVMVMLPEPQEDHDERLEVLVHRSQLLKDSFDILAYAEAENLQGGISIEFATEEATGPGVLREWFSLICREIFNPENALFLCCPNDRRRFFPNPASGVNPGHLAYFRFSGRVIALALMHRVQIDIVLASTFFKQLAGLPITWEDAQDADPCLYSSCKKILEMGTDFLDSDALGLTFVTEIEELGSRKVLELCPGGMGLAVNSKNRHQYVKLLIQRRFVTSVAEQVKCFAQGFSDLLGNSTLEQFLRALELEDLDLMLYGKDHDICVDDWKAHTEYHEYSEADDQIVWFWQVVDAMTMEQRRRLIFFSTSLTHLPAEGFSGLTSKFHIHKAHCDPSWLPTAHTCFYQLLVPPYPCFEVMHARLHAITEVHMLEGFGFA